MGQRLSLAHCCLRAMTPVISSPASLFSGLLCGSHFSLTQNSSLETFLSLGNPFANFANRLLKTLCILLTAIPTAWGGGGGLQALREQRGYFVHCCACMPRTGPWVLSLHLHMVKSKLWSTVNDFKGLAAWAVDSLWTKSNETGSRSSFPTK